MSVTAQQVLDDAIQRSSLNSEALVDQDVILTWMSSLENRAFLYAARVNPDFFGMEDTTTVRSAYTDSWDLATAPGNVGVISGLEVAAVQGSPDLDVGDEVYLVDRRFVDLEVEARVYSQGTKLIPVSTDLGSSNANMVTQLTVHYSELPPIITDLGQQLRIPDAWVDLIAVPLATRLSIRDRRLDEAQLLLAEHQQNLLLFIDHVQMFTDGSAKPLRRTQASVGIPQVQGS